MPRILLSCWLLLAAVAMSGCRLVEPAAYTLRMAARTQTDAPHREQSAIVDTSDAGQEQPLLRLLRFAPNTPDHRKWVAYGDSAAWHAAWGIARPTDFAAVEALPDHQRNLWYRLLTKQTTPPQALGIQYLAVAPMREFYGFGFFDADRFLEAGAPPQGVTVVETSIPTEQIGAALRRSGYGATPLEAGFTLYSMRGDYEADLRSPEPVGRIGLLNRIAAGQGPLVIARATAPVMGALATRQGEQMSLAADPAYQAAVAALDSPPLAAWGPPLGAILIGEMVMAGPLMMLGQDLPDVQEQWRRYAQAPLPPYWLTAFYTQRADDITYLSLVVVFWPGVDVAAAANLLGDRMQHYVSHVTGSPLDEWWSVIHASGAEIGGQPVAIVTMQAHDVGEARNQIGWNDLVARRDFAFAVAGEP